MKSDLKVKYLQFLLGKKKDNNEGFTLIELLVVVIIIGVLAAIALPSFLNQTAKAKQAEAKTTISQVNGAQATVRNTGNGFVADMAKLGLGLPVATNNYTYDITGAGDTAYITAQAANSAMKGYIGASASYTNVESLSAVASVICEAPTPGTTKPTPGTDAKADPAKTTTETAAVCANKFVQQ